MNCRRLCNWTLQLAICIGIVCSSAVFAETGEDDAQGPSRIEIRELESLLEGLDPKSPLAVACVPQLIAAISDKTVPVVLQQQAGMMLGRIGQPAEAAVPILIEAMQHSSAARPWALKSLGLFGDLAAESVLQLSSDLADRSRSHADRILVADVLGQIGTAAAVQALARELLRPETSDSPADALLRQVAVDAVAQARVRGIVALPALIRMTSDRNSEVRRKACDAIGGLGPRAELSLDSLLERLVLDDNHAVRDAAAMALAKIGPAAVPVLVRLVESGEAELQWRAAGALRRIGSRAATAGDALLRATDSDDDRVRLESLEAVWVIRGDAGEVAPRLLGELSASERQIRRRASELLITIDPLPQAVADQLEMLAQGKNREQSRAARYVLRERVRRAN